LCTRTGSRVGTPAAHTATRDHVDAYLGDHVDAYLGEVQVALERYDAYLWSNRNSSACCVLWAEVKGPTASTCCLDNASKCCPHSPVGPGPAGLLWSMGYQDSGEDGSDKYRNNTPPFVTMDMQGYSYDARRALARIATLRGDTAAAARWKAAAVGLAATAKLSLWRASRHAMFDRDYHGEWVSTLVHNNIRMMWHGLFDQGMADAFVAHHLMNRSEFWTTMPLPSISISDPRYQNTKGNNWSGQ
jgi:hypothetical protein